MFDMPRTWNIKPDTMKIGSFEMICTRLDSIFRNKACNGWTKATLSKQRFSL